MGILTLPSLVRITYIFVMPFFLRGATFYIVHDVQNFNISALFKDLFPVSLDFSVDRMRGTHRHEIGEPYFKHRKQFVFRIFDTLVKLIFLC